MNRKQTIKTNIKFKRGAGKELYGFVTKVGSSWRGCHEESTNKKKIVYVDEKLSANMKAGLLYHVTLIPMTDKDGFIAITAKQVKFTAKIRTELDDDTFRVYVIFGNKTFTYDPTSPSEKRRDMNAIAKLIREREDLEGRMEIADEFLDNASMAFMLYKRALKNHANVSANNDL